MTTLQIARAKEKYLEDALDVVASVMVNGDVSSSLAEDIESLVQDTVELFATLRRCDEQHSLLAATSDDYPYQEIENELATLFQQFLSMCNHLCALSDGLQDSGHEIESHHILQKVCAHARRLVQEDQTFYESEAYRTLTERAQAEYEAGQVEEWPA